MSKIFISIASYRDPELINTVHSLITNASNPELLRIVVFEQNGTDDISIIDIYPEWQVLVLQTHYSNAKGPVWARAKIQEEYNDEEYYMQIDSHMRVIKNWDTILKHMLNLLPNPSVLTQYPPEYKLENGNFDTNVIRSGLYIQGFGPRDGFTRIQSDIINSLNKRYYPYTSRAWSACFSFSKGSIIKDAPYDPSLYHLFFGEELDITLRLYTRGYYFFSPHKSVIFTLFKRSYRKTYWQDILSKEREKYEHDSWQRIRDRIKGVNHGIYSIGTNRSVDDYKKFANIISFEEQKLDPKAKTFRRYTKRILNR